MREGDYVESLINEYATVLGNKELKDAQGGYDESGIVFRQIGVYSAQVRS